MLGLLADFLLWLHPVSYTHLVIISALLGWWGIPFGPKFTLESIRTNMKGGKDVTDEVMATVAGHLLFQESHMAKII